jgi:hypothetical protein
MKYTNVVFYACIWGVNAELNENIIGIIWELGDAVKCANIRINQFNCFKFTGFKVPGLRSYKACWASDG